MIEMKLINVSFSIEDDLSRAMAIAAYAHDGQTDKAGKPYIHHPLALASGCPNDRSMLTLCFLHDVLEDRPEMSEHPDIRRFPAYILDALDAITRVKNESYPEYIERVMANELAKSVKILDLEHNMDITRTRHSLTTTDIHRLERYRWAWGRLNGLYDCDSSPSDY